MYSWVTRLAARSADETQLDRLAALHHHQPLAHVGDHREVVAHHDKGQAAAPAQLFQQVQHLGLHRRIERRRGLVQQQDLRLENQRARDGDALALPSRELVRIAKAEAGAEADLVERPLDPASRRRRCRGSPAARPGSGRPSGADAASRTDPGTPSARAGETPSCPAAAAVARARADPASAILPRGAPCPTRRARARRGRAARSTCPSPIRRRCRSSRRRRRAATCRRRRRIRRRSRAGVALRCRHRARSH